MAVEHTYNLSDLEVVESYSKAHDNGDRTDIAVIRLSDTHYAVIGLDSQPRDYDGITASLIDVLPSQEGAETRAVAWCGENPKGVDPDHGKGTVRKLLTGGTQS